MARKSTPTYVVELPLATTPNDERRLDAVAEAAKRLLNTVLQEGLKIVEGLRSDPEWAAARAMPKGATSAKATPKQREEHQARAEAYKAVRDRNRFAHKNRNDRWKVVHADVNGAFNIIRKIFRHFAYSARLTLKYTITRLSPRLGLVAVLL